MIYVIYADNCPNVTKQAYVYFHREGHGESGLVQDFQKKIMFLPSQSWDIVSMLCP